MQHNVGISTSSGAGFSLGPPATLASIFANGEKGFAYDFRTTTGLFQDAARSVPVVSSGDPVAGVTDKSPNGKHASNTAGTVRPLWNSGGYILFDGVNDYLQSASVDLTNEPVVTAFCKYSIVSLTGAVVVYESSSNYLLNQGGMIGFFDSTLGNRHTFGQHQQTPSDLAHSGYTLQTGTLYTITKYTIPSATYVTGVMVTVNGTPVTLTTFTDNNLTASTRGNYPWYMGARGGVINFANMQMSYLLIINRELSGKEQAFLNAL